ncbi:cyclic nucleotide-binding domain-containing thioredoxin-disulfide reductase [Agromyces sp. ISL-38]|uniref:FAD-dependent oxidoreductase n=1 Tax=Agromyces sp. ISL-38 TaxID=2819107 RepID=UPI001BE6E470|nr:cyclic nucleotide-binding domain-containing thioredoxin-disulfide reductase [Agromyces sp. ISL-38]MBT2518600.1 FAD-dependent oxidoreductase [Streptomyces sp. ISL-90]
MDSDRVVPELTDAQWDRLVRYGVPADVAAGEILVRSGDRWYDLILIESGEVEVVRDALPWIGESIIAAIGERTFFGELGLLNGQRAFLTARASKPGRMLRVDHASLQRLMAEDDELCDILLRTMWARREALRKGPAALTLKIIGTSRSAGSHALRRYAERLELAYTWVDADDPATSASLAGHGFTAQDLPVAIVQGENVLSATPGQVAEMLGLAYVNDDERAADLAVVGGGPAGLAAAIYGASEGLRTVLLDSIAPGGQSAATSRIENYLGFPFGVSGDALTGQASLQALKFGVRVFAPCEAAGLEWSPDPLTLSLSDGTLVRARAVIVTTGAQYRTLELDRWAQFEGAGIFHAATPLELRQVTGAPVVVVGGANSAGQAALYLAANGCPVRLVVRSDNLSTQMSSYLVERLSEHPRIQVHTRTSVTELHGDAALEQVTLAGGTNATVDCRGLFCFIGAQPATDWITQLDRDEHGFVRTGTDVRQLGPMWEALHRSPLPFETSLPRVFAAGDVRRGSMKRVAAAVGEGSSAVASVHRALAEVSE